MTNDYRDSHKKANKGKEYNASFFLNNYKNYIYNWEKKVLKKVLEEYKPNEYLDFACGTGRITRLAVDYANSVTGIDVSNSMLETARKEVAKGNFIERDITSKEFVSDVKYDFVTSFRFFTNAQNELRKEVMDKLPEMMANDSILVFNLHMNSSSPYALLARFREKLLGKRKGFNHLSLKDMKNGLGLEDNYKVLATYTHGIIPIIKEEKVYSKAIFNLIGIVEKGLSIFPGYKYFSKYQIIVCQKK